MKLAWFLRAVSSLHVFLRQETITRRGEYGRDGLVIVLSSGDLHLKEDSEAVSRLDFIFTDLPLFYTERTFLMFVYAL